MSAREDIAKNIQTQLQNMTDPALGSVSRDFFDVTKLAITQFPAVLITTTDETREDFTMAERQGVIRYNLRGYVRGTQIDTLRNELVERIEETLETSRDRDITLAATNIHNVTTKVAGVEVVERDLPLGEVVVQVDVTYRYKKGVV